MSQHRYGHRAVSREDKNRNDRIVQAANMFAPQGLSREDCVRIAEVARSVAPGSSIDRRENAFNLASLIITLPRANRLPYSLMISRIDSTYFLDEVRFQVWKKVGEFQSLAGLLYELRVHLASPPPHDATVYIISPEERELLTCLEAYWSSTGCAPSFEEIRDALKTYSRSALHRLISVLEGAGLISRLPDNTWWVNEIAETKRASTPHRIEPGRERIPSGTPMGVPSTEDIAAKPLRVRQHVLLVDDAADVLVAVGAFLVGEGFVVVSAPDGDTALRLIAEDPQIEILITDYAMPGISGVDLIAEATQIRRNLKALLITGYPNADGLAGLPSHVGIIVKPFRRAKLIAKVKALIFECPPAMHSDPSMLKEALVRQYDE